MDLTEIKAAIRAILMALGRCATEKEFRSEYFNQEGESFNSVLRQFRMTFFEFLKSIPDVCRVYKLSDDDIFVTKVSHEDSKHMDALTVVKNRRRLPRFRQGPRFNVFRPIGRPAPCFPTYHQQYCAPAPPRQIKQPVIGFPAFTRPRNAFAAAKPQPVVPATLKHFVPVPKKPTVKCVPLQKLSLALPPHMMMKPINFGPSVDESQKEIASPEPIQDEKKPEDDLNKSNSSNWSDEKSLSRKPSLKLNRFRLSLTDTLKRMKELEKENPQKEPNKSDTDLENPATGSGHIHQALQNCQKNSQRHEEKPRPSSVLNNYITGVFAIPQAHLKTIKCLRSFEVTVVNAQSPSQFGFTFSPNQLQELHAEMELHYSVANGLIVEKPEVGMPVAVSIDDKWYRAEILYINPNDVLIFLVDVGKRKYVNNSELRYLEKVFASVSRKACKGRLFGVQPDDNTGQWSTEAKKFFSQNTENAKLRATVKAFKDGVYELLLLNESDPHSKIAEHLVTIGLAKKTEEIDSSLVAILV